MAFVGYYRLAPYVYLIERVHNVDGVRFGWTRISGGGTPLRGYASGYQDLFLDTRVVFTFAGPVDLKITKREIETLHIQIPASEKP
jgi:hypothetical protein